MMTSAPACAARTASGTPPAMNVTLQPAAWARSTYRFTSCCGNGQAKAITDGRRASAEARESSSISTRRKFKAKGRFVRSRIGAVPARTCSGVKLMTAHRAETACAGHGCHQFRGVHGSHPAKRDWMIYVQEVTYRRSDHDFALRLGEFQESVSIRRRVRPSAKRDTKCRF